MSEQAGAKPTIVLVHGAYADASSWNSLLSQIDGPVLAAAGYRVLVPFVRGYGTTRFLSGDTPRNGQQAAVAADVIAFMDALGIENAILAGFDSPEWAFDDATFERSAAAFGNPDHVAIVIHNYRWRIGLAAGEPRYDDTEARLAAAPAIAVPSITMEGDANGAVGHNLPQEAPQAFAQAVIDVDHF